MTQQTTDSLEHFIDGHLPLTETPVFVAVKFPSGVLLVRNTGEIVKNRHARQWRWPSEDELRGASAFESESEELLTEVRQLLHTAYDKVSEFSQRAVDADFPAQKLRLFAVLDSADLDEVVRVLAGCDPQFLSLTAAAAMYEAQK